jgi:transposase
MFCLEVSARKAARHLRLDYKTVYSRYMRYRHVIARKMTEEFIELCGEIECDESYFGGRRKGKRGRGSAGKTKVFGLLERNGRVYVTIVENVKAGTLLKEIKEKTVKGSVFYTDTFKSYRSLKKFGKHKSVNHQECFANKRAHINGIEGFWSFAKERLAKYHGVASHLFGLYLKEQEFRFNYRNDNIFKILKKWISPENG